MSMSIRPSRAVFAVAMIGLGIVALLYGNESLVWQEMPRALPHRQIVIDFFALIMLAAGIGLCLRPLVTSACRALFLLLLVWAVWLKVPFLVRNPLTEVNWESFAETAVMLAGAWCLLAAHAGAFERRYVNFVTGESGVRGARLLLIAALPMMGLSHFFYYAMTESLVPRWMGFAAGWTYFTGSASIAAAAGMLLGVVPRLSANLEALMISLITVLVWVPRLLAMPQAQENWTEFLISCGMTAGLWVVAATWRDVAWFASSRNARAVSLD